MNHRTITPAEAATLIYQSNGTTFNVGFYKRGKKNGEGRNEFREMRARLGSTVKKDLAGGPPAYDPTAHGLIWAYLMAGDENRTDETKNRRSIPVSGIVELNIGGEKYRVSGAPH
jgi:hypothetical protein